MTWNAVPTKMEQGRRIKGTVQRLIQGLSIGDEMGCIEAYKCPLKEKNGHGNDRLMQMQTHANGFQRATMGTLVHLFVIYLYHTNGFQRAAMDTLAHLLAIYLYHVNGFRIATMRTTATWRARREGEGNRMCAGGYAPLTGRLSLPCPLPYYIYRLRNRDYPAPRCRGKGQARSGQCLDSWPRRKRKSNGRDRRRG